jgi:choline kinase
VKYIILAAGKGERLRPLTSNQPKSLLHIHNTGTTILDHQIRSFTPLLNDGDEIVIVVGYLGHLIEDYVSGLNRKDIRIVHNPLFGHSNNLVSLWIALIEVEDDVVIINGDNVVSHRAVSSFLSNKSENIFAITRKSNFDFDDMRALEHQGKLADVGKKIEVYNAESVGFMRFDSSKIKQLRETIVEVIEGDAGLTSFYLRAISILCKRVDIQVVEIDSDEWREVDFHPDKIELDYWWSKTVSSLGVWEVGESL